MAARVLGNIHLTLLTETNEAISLHCLLIRKNCSPKASVDFLSDMLWKNCLTRGHIWIRSKPCDKFLITYLKKHLFLLSFIKFTIPSIKFFTIWVFLNSIHTYLYIILLSNWTVLKVTINFLESHSKAYYHKDLNSEMTKVVFFPYN